MSKRLPRRPTILRELSIDAAALWMGCHRNEVEARIRDRGLRFITNRKGERRIPVHEIVRWQREEAERNAKLYKRNPSPALKPLSQEEYDAHLARLGQQ